MRLRHKTGLFIVLMATASAAFGGFLEGGGASPATTFSDNNLGKVHKETATGYASNVYFDTQPVLHIALKKGLAKRLIRVDLTIAAAGFDAGALNAWAKVNGVPMWGSAYQYCPQGPYGYSECSVSGVFWLDVDAVEANPAHTGKITGMPLDVAIYADNYVGEPSFWGEMTAVVQMVKK